MNTGTVCATAADALVMHGVGQNIWEQRESKVQKGKKLPLYFDVSFSS
jgi:hypothetical protein